VTGRPSRAGLLASRAFADTTGLSKDPGTGMRIYANFFKRVVDLVSSSLLLIVLSPLLLLLALVVRLDTPGPAFFSQSRLGERGTVFKLVKFRTMTHAQRTATREIYDGDHPEITRSGSWMRRFKLDELPQLWNVLIGDMSLIGPRPCLPEQVATFNEDGRMRLRVRPGMTGLAQVSGNIFIPWPERWRLDRQYVENLTLVMDLRIIARTVLVVLQGERQAGGK
jgi:undecaprenyl phosphate N,N'-diacetylbacillosamine 1-phosphate transferase